MKKGRVCFEPKMGLPASTDRLVNRHALLVSKEAIRKSRIMSQGGIESGQYAHRNKSERKPTSNAKEAFG